MAFTTEIIQTSLKQLKWEYLDANEVQSLLTTGTEDDWIRGGAAEEISKVIAQEEGKTGYAPHALRRIRKQCEENVQRKNVWRLPFTHERENPMEEDSDFAHNPHYAYFASTQSTNVTFVTGMGWSVAAGRLKDGRYYIEEGSDGAGTTKIIDGKEVEYQEPGESLVTLYDSYPMFYQDLLEKTGQDKKSEPSRAFARNIMDVLS